MTDSYVAWKGWKSTAFGRCNREQAVYFAAELRASGIKSVVGLMIGEIGFGNGEFAGWVQQAGGRWLGQECSTELQNRARAAGFTIISSTEGFAIGDGTDKFDLIVAFDVIEHLSLDEIRSILCDVKSALRDGGLLIIRCPSGDSPFSGSNYYGDLTHRTLIGSSAAVQLAMEVGLEPHQVRGAVLPIWGLGTIRAVRRMSVRVVRALTFYFIQHVLIGDSRAILSPNMIIALRKEENKEGPSIKT